MNPELIDSSVIETASNIIDQSDCNDFQSFEEDDPLADPLSTNITSEIDETDEFDIPCSVIDKQRDPNVQKGETDHIRLVDVAELKAKAPTEQLPVVIKRPEPQPSCSKASSSLQYCPPTPNFELDDLEDLIQSSRICTKPVPVPLQEKPSTSYVIEDDEIVENPDEIHVEIIDDDSECEASDGDQSCEKGEKEKIADREEIKAVETSPIVSEEINPMLLLELEDFEDQIEQIVLNKTDLHQIIEVEIEESVEVSECNEEDIEPVKVNETTETNDLPSEMEPVTQSLIEEALSPLQNEPSVIETKTNEVCIESDQIQSAVEVVSDVADQEVSVEIGDQVDPSMTLETTVTGDLCVVPSSESIMDESLSVVVEAVDVIQHQSSSGVESSQSAVSTSMSDEPVRDEEDGGLRSDGSDSGLGSEPSHNGSGLLDKSLTKLPDPPAKGNLKRRSSERIDGCSAIETKRSKKGIQFEGVTVYSFPRQQGFSCVPSQGGCTLGMANQHCNVMYYTLTEHSAEQRRNHRQQLAELNPRSSSSDDDGRIASSDDADSEYEPTDSSSEADSEVYGFLQPVSQKQRRALLKSAGIRKIDGNEKEECKMIRTSREVCGCTCRVYCDPDTCACSQAGIKCQVDRPNFPCGCTLEGCGNVVGRVEFSPMRVQSHYIHTKMKLQMENKQDRLRSSTNAASTASSNSYKAWQVQQQQQQQQQQLQSNIRQVPSSSNSGSSCVDGRSMIEQSQPQQHCDFSLIYDNHSSISSGMVTDISPVNVPTSDLRYSYQSDTSYANHIIEYVPKPSTSYPTTSSYDPNTAYMTAYPEQQPQQQQQYLHESVPYEASTCMQNTTYQLHSYDHLTYPMQSQINYAGSPLYNQYPATPPSLPPSAPSSTYPCLQPPIHSIPPMTDLLIRQSSVTAHHDRIYHNGYLQNQLQLCESMYHSTTNQTQQMGPGSNTIMTTTPHYDTTVSSNNNCNIIPANKTLMLENPSNINAPAVPQMVVTTGNNENLCEIIKKGIVETVSG